MKKYHFFVVVGELQNLDPMHSSFGNRYFSISVVLEELQFLGTLFLWLQRRNCGSLELYFCGCGGAVVPWKSISVIAEELWFLLELYFCGCEGAVVPWKSISVVAEELWFLGTLFLWLWRNCGPLELYFCGCGGTVVPWNSISVDVEEQWSLGTLFLWLWRNCGSLMFQFSTIQLPEKTEECRSFTNS